MNEFPSESPDAALERALDQALARSLKPPPLGAGFRRALEAAIARSSHDNHALLRARLEHEHRELITDLHDGYVRISRRALGTLVAAAFAGGLAAVVAMPWLSEHFGSHAWLVLSGIGAAVALACGALSWWPRSALARRLG